MKQNYKYKEERKAVFMGVLLLGIFILSFLELFKYNGFVQRYLLIKLDFLYVLYVVVWFTDLFINEKPNKHYGVLALRILLSIFLATTILSITLNYIEFRNYTNYVLAHYHIALSVLPKIIIFESVLIPVFAFQTEIRRYLMVIGKHMKRDFGETTLFCLSLGFLSYYLVVNTVSVFNYFNVNLFTIVSKPKASYVEKMEMKMGNYFVFMNFIKEKTSDNSIIITPPYEEPWLFFSNFALARYFLYPRQLMIYDGSLFDMNSGICAKSRCYIMMLKYTDPDFIWPLDNFPSKKVFYFNKDDWGKVGEEVGYYPDKESAKLKTWGIIEN